MEEKITEIYNNIENGNRGLAREQIYQLTHLQFLDLIERMRSYKSMHLVVSDLRSLLSV